MTKITLPFNEKYNISPTFDLDNNSRVLILTGAGASVGSGLPTYHKKTEEENNGFYTNKEPEKILNDYNMYHHPEIIWQFIKDLLIQGLDSKPADTHKHIANFDNFTKETMVFTQNVDNLHKKAGSKNIVPIHGEGEYCVCYNCTNRTNNFKVPVKDILDQLESNAPKCPKCNDILRPDIVPFEGMYDLQKMQRIETFLNEPVDLCFIVGTQMHFPYIQGVVEQAKRINAKLNIIVVNPDPDFRFYLADFHYNMNSDYFFNDIIIK